MTGTARQVAVVGVTGYVGREIQGLLRKHPHLELAQCLSARENPSGLAETETFEPEVAPFDPARLDGVDGVFICAPHGKAAPLVTACTGQNRAIVDLSADFRLPDAAAFERVYGTPHGAPELLSQATYGLTEQSRDRIRAARLVANPGCYPTSVLLPLKPLLDAGLLDAAAPIIADSKSGVSGAGKTPTARNVFGAVHDNCSAYSVGTHRHGPEIAVHAGTDRVLFVPHLLPVFRGILTTLYLQPRPGTSAVDVLGCLAEAYGDELLVRVQPRRLPELLDVVHHNHCDLGVAQHGDHVVVVAALDNLRKGAASQAIQNMNLMLGLPETAGLLP
ncbi:MAG: N-acetyl-gamma-glutamyl-phosphate reductase [Planctomycetota bacterium]